MYTVQQHSHTQIIILIYSTIHVHCTVHVKHNVRVINPNHQNYQRSSFLPQIKLLSSDIYCLVWVRVYMITWVAVYSLCGTWVQCTPVLSSLAGRAWYKVWKVMFWSSESYDMNNSYSGYVVALKYWNKNGGLSCPADWNECLSQTTLSFMTDQESFFVEGRDLDSVIFIANWYSRAINSFLPIIVLAIEISNEA